MTRHAILIDGYNVIRTTPGLAVAEQRGDLAAGRAALLGRLAAAFARSTERIYVVFDGAGPAESRHSIPGLPHGRVVYSRLGDTADALIFRMQMSDELRDFQVVVVSSDEEVRREAARCGAATHRAEALAAHLNRAPKSLRQRQRARLGATWDNTPVDEDGEPIRRSRKGNAHRAPRGSEVMSRVSLYLHRRHGRFR